MLFCLTAKLASGKLSHCTPLRPRCAESKLELETAPSVLLAKPGPIVLVVVVVVSIVLWCRWARQAGLAFVDIRLSASIDNLSLSLEPSKCVPLEAHQWRAQATKAGTTIVRVHLNMPPLTDSN